MTNTCQTSRVSSIFSSHGALKTSCDSRDTHHIHRMSFADSTPPTHGTLSDIQEAVQKTLAGDAGAFALIVSEHEQKIASFLMKRCPNKADAADLLQETFIAAYKNLSQYNADYPFGAWIFGIARNKANEHFRKVQKLPILSEDQPEPSHGDTPHQQLSTIELADLFWKEAQRILSEEQFSSLWLKYQEDKSIAEISEILKKTVSNIKIHLFRARKALAQSSLLATQFSKLIN